jgi:hypothetical protein
MPPRPESPPPRTLSEEFGRLVALCCDAREMRLADALLALVRLRSAGRQQEGREALLDLLGAVPAGRGPGDG